MDTSESKWRPLIEAWLKEHGTDSCYYEGYGWYSVDRMLAQFAREQQVTGMRRNRDGTFRGMGAPLWLQEMFYVIADQV